MGNQRKNKRKMNRRVFAVAALLLCAPIYGSGPKGISTIYLDGKEYEWSK